MKRNNPRKYSKANKFQRKSKDNEGQIPDDAIGQEVGDVCALPSIQDDESYDLSNDSEDSVGITSYLFDSSPFQGILKHKFHDFVVREIEDDGNVVYLKSFVETKGKAKLDDTEKKILYDKGLEIFKTRYGDENYDKLLNILDTHEGVVTLEIDDKNERKELHQLVRESFPMLVSDTEQKSLRIRFLGYKDDNLKFDKRGVKITWPPDRPNYLKFTLHKINIDTMSAIYKLSSQLNCKTNVFSFSGTKDKRAITTQKITAYRVTEDRLAWACRASKCSLTIGDCQYTPSELKFGHHQGNNFTITLRDIKGNIDDIEKVCEMIGIYGFINYYGLQRFGSIGCMSSHNIGKLLLHCGYKEAVEYMLRPVKDRNDSLLEAKEVYQATKDPSEALKHIPKSDHSVFAEPILLNALIGHPDDYQFAFEKIPLQSRTIYIHAIQSFFFNELCSYRISQFGNKVSLHDYVLDPETNNIIEATEDILQSDKYTIFNVVIPQLSVDMEVPKNLQGYYQDLLTKHNLLHSDWSCSHISMSLKGSYRHLLEKPIDFSHKFIYYHDENDVLLLSDIDKILNRNVDAYSAVMSNDRTSGCKYTALQMQFSLNTGTYATMLLRELMKFTTSAKIHQQRSHTQ